MTGPEHYRKAEQVVNELRRARSSMTTQVSHERAATALAEAQVHATLALVAATAVPGGGPGTASAGAWVTVVHGIGEAGGSDA